MPISFDTLNFHRQAKADGLAVEQFGNPISAAQYATVYRKTLEYARPGEKVLDWGAGNGHFAHFLTCQGLDTTTFSFSLAGPLAQLQHIAGSDPVAIPVQNETFDKVFSIGVLEHVHETGGDQAASMREIARILRPGGAFLCFHLPNRLGWVEPVKGWLKPDAHIHSRKFISADIMDLCRGAGFDLLDIGRYNFLPRNEAGSLLGPISRTSASVAAFNGLDWLLTTLMPRWATNYYFVARKPSGTGWVG